MLVFDYYFGIVTCGYIVALVNYFMSKKIVISKEEFKKFYEKDKLNTFQIAKKLGCCQATAWKKLKEFNINPRLPGVKRVNIPKNKLYDLYINKKLSTWSIEKQEGIPRGTIHRKLKEYGIETRDLATANIKYEKFDFSENLIEKAYLIGFRIGDLRVRKQYKNSKTICVACGSTIQEQIDLLENLFKNYGRIWKKEKNGKINFEAFLNESFEFLMSKKAPDWIFNNENYFFAFLAGFTDAEGNIGVYDGRARYYLGNYDFKLLFLIYKKLNEYGVICNKPISDKRKGKMNNEGYRYNQNYWHFQINKKDVLFSFLLKIKPCIMHKKKVKALNIAIENIIDRGIKKMDKNKNFQISTAIDYPSGKFHLGHAYEKVCTDIIARWKRLRGFNVHFSTGTDCHGLKIERAAEKAGKTPEGFVNEISDGFKQLSSVLNISYDDFIMTTEKRHEKVVLDILKKLEKNGDIYKGEYEGSYCVDCETYYTEKDVVDGCCPVHKNKLEKVKEKTYFFRLGKYQNKLIKSIKNDNLIWPEKKKKEILNRLKEPLRDLSISREKVKWGIPLPFEKGLTLFVWVEALMNYLTTIDYPNKKFKDFWPAVHIIGSDIVWHHTVIWYSILSSLGIKLPKVVVHGFINLKGEKLSKSRGITIDPIDLANRYSVDALRYFLIRNIIFGQDGDYSEEVLIERNNNELVNKLGNLVSRVAGLAEKNGIEKCDNKLLKKLKLKEIQKHFDNYELDKVLNEVFAFIDRCNEYVQNKKPWETKDKKVLYELIDSIKAIGILLWPFIPETSEKIAKQFGFKIKFDEIKKGIKVGKIKKGEHLFNRI